MQKTKKEFRDFIDTMKAVLISDALKNEDLAKRHDVLTNDIRQYIRSVEVGPEVTITTSRNLLDEIINFQRSIDYECDEPGEVKKEKLEEEYLQFEDTPVEIATGGSHCAFIQM